MALPFRANFLPAHTVPLAKNSKVAGIMAIHSRLQNDWIICTQVKGEGVTTVSKKEFQDRYKSWRAYRDVKIIRKDFDGKTKASPYVISIFHEFDSLV
jgi:hypothetical protein